MAPLLVINGVLTLINWVARVINPISGVIILLVKGLLRDHDG